ncbi:hypothetical protein HC891_09480 [Candidatus Gracilibacteria bacterium]|nr:hypothetical protein [Candidatus Gracilibacteria bacterium]
MALALPLLDPAALNDPSALDQVLAEAVARAERATPIVLIYDAPTLTQPLAPPQLFLQNELPPGVFVVYGCTPETPLPLPTIATIDVVTDNSELYDLQQALLDAWQCPSDLRARLLHTASGNLLYLALATRFSATGLMSGAEIPGDLAGLYALWWSQLSAEERSLAALVLAAGAPLPLTARLLARDALPLVETWQRLGLVRLEQAEGELLIAPSHRSLVSFVAEHQPQLLVQTHSAIVGVALEGERLLQTNPDRPATARYLGEQFARHAALATTAQRGNALDRVTQRDWVRHQERRGAGLSAVARDLAWELNAAAREGPAFAASVGRQCLLAPLALRARVINPDAAAVAFEQATATYGREGALKRVLEMVEHLPDGLEKAQTLRRLGESCYGLRMRASAMRLLSRALDLEERGLARSWREQREQLHAALASAACDLGDVSCALQIAEYIAHLERRAMVETTIVRYLLAHGDLVQAQRVARNMLHENMGAWARAEVAVAQLRAGDERGRHLLDEIGGETARAWALIELACDAAPSDEATARRWLDSLPNAQQRDRGLARLALALATAELDGDALAAAEEIDDVEVRVDALLDLRLRLEGLVAMLALERATSDIDALTGDARVPLLSALAAAHAALGRGEHAIAIVMQLGEGEERDRALARVAVGLARHGDIAAAQAVVERVTDDDERDWALDEIGHLFADGGRWQEAQRLVASIGSDEQRARTQAEIAVVQARSGEALAAWQAAMLLTNASERSRALTVIAPLLIAQGHAARALNIADNHELFTSAEARSRYRAGLVAALAASRLEQGGNDGRSATDAP